MKRFIYCLLTLMPASLFAQQAIETNPIEEPKYDTTSIHIKSTNSFSFCSKLYKIPGNCDNQNKSSCCSFSRQVHVGEKLPTSGHFTCYDGTSLYWTYYESDDQAKSAFERYPRQIKKQTVNFKQTKIKLLICQQEAAAYKLNYTSHQGYKAIEIIAYANINRQDVFVQLRSQKNLNSSAEIESVFRQILDTNVIEEPKYDTTYIDMRSTNSFSFCSKLYKIPRDCGKRNESNCCSFSREARVGEKLHSLEQLGCNDGTTLVWTYYESEHDAKSEFDGYSPQIKRQMKQFTQTKIKLSICNQEADAYRLNCTTHDGNKENEIITYARINGQNVVVHLLSDKKLNSSKEIQPIFQQILQF